MGFRAVCIENRCKCSYQSGYLVVTNADTTTKIHLSEIASLTFCTTQVYVSGYLMSELAKNKIPVVFSDEKCNPIAESLPLYGAHNCSGRVADQLEWTLPSKKRVWQQVVRHKIGAQAELLELDGHDREAKILRSYREDVRSGDTTNREAAAAAVYFPAIFGDGFSREQDSAINASLNYGYSVLLSKVNREVVSRGYLTQIGINHRGELNQWNLSCDLMEPFRPYVDYTVLYSGLPELNTQMKRLLIDMMNREVRYKDGNYKVSSVTSLYVLDCLEALGKKGLPEEIEMYSLR